jgi:hypothetical protein
MGQGYVAAEHRDAPSPMRLEDRREANFIFENIDPVGINHEGYAYGR